MKKTTLLYALLFSFVLLPGSACAENSWWNKGADILKTLSNEPATQTVAKLSYADISKAFKQALSIGAENVVNQVGTLDGFNAAPSIHIPLPKELNTIKTVLSKVGMSQMVDDLELKLNRAAEAAAPKAKNLFLQAIAAMTFDDVQNIYKGPEDSATKYFQSKMTPSLEKEMQPIIDNTLSQVGAIKAYDNVMGEYKALPFVPDVKANLTEHVLQRGMEGIFYYMAKEEAAIRKDPVRQTTNSLKKVFGVQ